MYVISISSNSRLSLTTRRISLLILAVAALLWPLSAFAHAKLVSSDPKADATLASAPHRVTLVFSEKPEPSLSALKLVGPVGDTIPLQSLRLDSANAFALTADVPVGIVPGSYRLLWTAAGKDGHPSHGALRFFVEMAQKREFSPIPVDDPQAFDNSSASMAVAGALGSIVVRWLAFASCFVLIGVMTFRYLIIPRMSSGANDLFAQIATTNAATLGVFSAALSLLAAMLKLARESSDMPDASLGSMLLRSSWGLSLVAQIMSSIAAGFALYYVHRNNRGWRTALVATAVLGASSSFAAHAASSTNAIIAVPLDLVHVVVGGMWLGTLTVIVIVGISAALKVPDAARPGARVAQMINIFSPLALTCGGAVVLTGLGSSVIEIPQLSALWTTPYGVILLLKVFFVALLFLAGAWNWRRMKPRLTGDDAIAPLRSSASFELMIAVAVLAVTSILVALELP